MNSLNICFHLKDFTKVVLFLGAESFNGFKLFFQLSSLGKLMESKSRMCILQKCNMSLIE